MKKMIAAFAAGAAVAYWMDPENGAARRARTKDQWAALGRDFLSATTAKIE